MITHVKRQQLFDVMVSFVFFLGPGYFLKPYARRRDDCYQKSSSQQILTSLELSRYQCLTVFTPGILYKGKFKESLY